MNKTLLFGPALLVILGCAAARAPAPPPSVPAPSAAPAPDCACRPGWLTVSVPAPWEWREGSESGCCRGALFHIITSVYVEITLAAAPDPASFAGSAAALRREMSGLGYDVTDEAVLGEDGSGRPIASLHFRGSGEYAHIRGKAVFRGSMTPGTILVFVGTWHYISEPNAEAAFDDVVRGAFDRPTGE